MEPMRRLGRGDDAVTVVMGTLLMLGMVFVLAVVVLFVAVGNKQTVESPPHAFAFAADMGQGTIQVVAAPRTATWDGLRVNGCSQVPTGAVRASDLISGCAGQVTIIELPSNTLLASYAFPSPSPTP